MKKIIITLAAVVMPSLIFAQSAFDKFQDKEGIGVVLVNKGMLDLIGGIQAPAGGEKAQKLIDQVNNLDNIRIFTTSKSKYIKEMRSAVTDYLKQNPLEQLMSVTDEGSKVKIYVKPGSTPSQIKEFLLFVEDNEDKEVVLISFTGNINLNDLK